MYQAGEFSIAFASPRALPRAETLVGQVVVLDIAFTATTSTSVSFEQITGPFIRALDTRLAAWVDHHDHERHAEFTQDSRFTLATKAEHGACPEMVTRGVVERAGHVDTILCHVDLDGVYSAAKWALRGEEPYPGADADARAVDTRTGEVGPIGRTVDRAIRARFRDDELKIAIFNWLVEGLPEDKNRTLIYGAAREFLERTAGTEPLSKKYEVKGQVAYVDVRGFSMPFDKTDLLLLGQKLAPVAAVHDSGFVTFAAAFDSGWDFVSLLSLGGGMPTRVSVPDARLDEAIQLINLAKAHPRR